MFSSVQRKCISFRELTYFNNWLILAFPAIPLQQGNTALPTRIYTHAIPYAVP
ncbi:hypothetical protein ACVWY9_001165 [Thermostichus sp. OS-CIW-31]|jgi:hypothetical protein